MHHNFIPFSSTEKKRISLFVNGYFGKIGRNSAMATLFLLSACNFGNPKKVLGVDSLRDSIALPIPSSIAPEENERIRKGCEAWYNSALKQRGFNGGIVVAKNNNIVFEAYNGCGQIGGTDTINSNTPFHIASVSKTFTAMAVLKLWQEGKLNIDAEFSTYFPAFNYPGVTVRWMLSHRSGLPNYVHFMDNLGWDPKVFLTNEDVLNLLISKKAVLPNVGAPNRSFTYCNTNYALLALLIEKVSGKKYGDYLQATFFGPLKMKNTFVYNPQRDLGHTTISYDYRGKAIAPVFLDNIYGDKNIYSTPRDLLLWDRGLTSGLLFTPKTLEQAYAPYSNEKAGIRNYGLGWRMNNFASGKKMIYHNGWWHGNNAVFIRLIQDSATIIVLGNRFDKGIYHAKDLAHLFGNYYGDSPEEGPENAAPAATKVIIPAAKPKVAAVQPKRITQKNIRHSTKKLAKQSIKKAIAKKAKPIPKKKRHR